MRVARGKGREGCEVVLQRKWRPKVEGLNDNTFSWASIIDTDTDTDDANARLTFTIQIIGSTANPLFSSPI